MGRPTVLDDLVSKKFRDAVAGGIPRRYAAALAGVTYTSIKRWLRSNPDFCALVEKADADALARNLLRVQDGVQGWQGSAWWLERRHPKLFPRQAIPVAQDPNAAGKRLEDMSDAELQRVAERKAS